MWHREDLKERARLALKDNGYWRPVLMMWVFLLLTASLGLSGNEFGLIYRLCGPNARQLLLEMQRNLPLSAWFWGAMAVLSLAFQILVINPLTVGRNRYFLLHRAFRPGFSTLFEPFRSGYINTVRAMLMTDLITLLWTLLLVVPGVIKAYQYYFVPALLAENPKLDWRRAMRISRDMTQGSKFEIFVMALSFLGWSFLALVLSAAIAFWAYGAFSNAFSGLFNQLVMLTRGVMPELLRWLLGADTTPVTFPPEYAARFIALNLSGLALYYLSGLLSCPAVVLLAPYYHGAFADLYAVLRARALVAGFATREELPGFGWTDERALEESILAAEPAPRVLTEDQTQHPPE
jgi:hypothetical protein